MSLAYGLLLVGENATVCTLAGLASEPIRRVNKRSVHIGVVRIRQDVDANKASTSKISCSCSAPLLAFKRRPSSSAW